MPVKDFLLKRKSDLLNLIRIMIHTVKTRIYLMKDKKKSEHRAAMFSKYGHEAIKHHEAESIAEHATRHPDKLKKEMIHPKSVEHKKEQHHSEKIAKAM